MKKIGLLSVLVVWAVSATAGIMIYPKHLFFDDKTKSAEITLINSSPLESANYRITLTYQRQNPDGSYTPVTTEELPADSVTKFLRYSPRSVMLTPSQSQTVRVLKRLPADVKPGEYVGYITFTEVLLEKPATKQNTQPGAMSITLTPIPSFSVPIFLRYKVKENAPVTLRVQGVRDEKNGAVLTAVLTRQAQEIPTSARGDLSVWDGEEMIGLIRGRYLLPSNTSVQTQIPLYLKDAQTDAQGKKHNQALSRNDLKGKTLRVLFTQPDEGPVQKENVLAKAEITL